jgi:hypothetical protein
MSKLVVPADDDLVERLPSAALFYRGTVPEPLNEEVRQWLVEQLHRYPERVNEARTCSIGALTEMATTEFCRLMAAIASLSSELARCRNALEEVRDLLSERIYGNPARSPAHNARVKLDTIIAALNPIGEEGAREP